MEMSHRPQQLHRLYVSTTQPRIQIKFSAYVHIERKGLELFFCAEPSVAQQGVWSPWADADFNAATLHSAVLQL